MAEKRGKMNLPTHYIIAKLAAENAGLTLVKRTAFCIGAMLPDLSPNQFIHRHFYRKSGEYIMKKLQRLSGKSSVFSLLAMGKAAHYVSDFCCSVHFGGSIGNARQHLLYEQQLHRYAAEKYPTLKAECSSFTGSHSVQDALSEYFDDEKFDFHTDLIYAVKACYAICRLAKSSKNIFVYGISEDLAIDSPHI